VIYFYLRLCRADSLAHGLQLTIVYFSRNSLKKQILKNFYWPYDVGFLKGNPMTTVIWKSHKSSELPDRPYRIVEAIGWQVRMQSHAWSPPTDIFEIETGYVVRVEVAGMHHQDFSIQLEDNYLIISGTRHDKPERRAYHQMEVRFGEFSTIVAIPGPVYAEKASAEYNDGFLIVSLPKTKTDKI
jgi:HSP20 family protein